MNRRSASVGALPREKKHFVSRNESASGVSLDVRCACQYFECDSLLPERINPVDSRPSSRLEFHSDLNNPHGHLQPMNADQALYADQLSVHSFNVAGHSHIEMDHISLRSVGAHGYKSVDQQSTPPVDLTFMDKYPELEQTARSRGLVVRSISDATDEGVGPSTTFLAGHRRRQLSVGGISIGSGKRDPETMSMRSVTSLRRISRSPSKADLFVADINIPISPPQAKREQRSVSVSRRSSNVDLSRYDTYHDGNAPATTAMHMMSIAVPPHLQTPPELNLIAPTPSPMVATKPPDFTSIRASTPMRSITPGPTDYRNAKPPMSTDYMRPDDNKENIRYNAQFGMPQNRPIDVSMYDDEPQISLPLKDESHFTLSPFNTTSNRGSRQTSPLKALPSDRLEQTVAELESIMTTQNIEDIRDNIKLETKKPPSFTDEIRDPSVDLGEETKIQIVSSVPVVDIDMLVQNEIEKAAVVNSQMKPSPRHQSPPEKRQKFSFSQTQEVLQPPLQKTITQREGSPFPQFKAQPPLERPPSKQAALTVHNLDLPEPIEMHATTLNGAISLQDASPEVKNTYTSRFKTMFGGKNNDTVRKFSPQRQKSASPKRSKSPSPAPVKLMTMFTKSKPTKIEIVNKGSPVVTKKAEAEPMAVKVTETFSLKVDDMDQYSSRPVKQAPSMPRSIPVPPSTLASSRDDFSAVSDHVSVDLSEAFTPIVLPAKGQTKFLAGNRSFYASESEMQIRRSDSDFRHSSREPSIGHGSHFQVPRGALISIPINIEHGGRTSHSLPRSSSLQQNLSHSSSEQAVPPNLVHKSSSMRRYTQSQSHDRARVSGSNEDIYGQRITKTVSFHFNERKSRLSEFQNSSTLQQQKFQRDNLERTYFSRDHEYEPIGTISVEGGKTATKEPSPQPKHSMEVDSHIENIKDAEELQRNLEERYFSSETTTPRTESRTDYEIHTSQVDSSALEELPLKPENRKKGFMAAAQDRTRKVQAGFRNQAGKLKTKLKPSTKKSGSPKSSPKAKERRRFKAPEFSKIKMPDIKRPDMSKLKEFKRPEFTKFNKPDMSKFKLPEKFTALKLRRSKSFKENEMVHDEEISGVTPESAGTTETQQQKKLFEFNFGTYPRAFRRKKRPTQQSSFYTETSTEGPSIVQSTETQPSIESSSSPQGDRGPGPVRSRWADKFSDVSYNDSEGSRYRRYGSEQESFDRESSLERRMKEDLEESGSEVPDMGILSGVADTKQFADYSEENRAIHEISNLRAGEFKRRPIVHQDSDLRSEDSKEAVGWTEKEIEKNKLLRKAELEAETTYLKYPNDEELLQDTQSTASSGKKVVMEEIDDDEFFLRKRGISEDNIELRQYISNAIREGYDMPINTLERVGQRNVPYDDYDIPPPKPRRLHKGYRQVDDSQDFEPSRSDYGDDLSISQNGSDFFTAPRRPMRKGRSRSKYSIDSQDAQIVDDRIPHEQYFDDDEDYLRPPRRIYKERDTEINNLDYSDRELFGAGTDEMDDVPRPVPRTRRKRQLRESSIEKDPYIKGFTGRSVSNSFMQPHENVIVYRTEHQYHIPLATPENYTDGASAESRLTRSTSKFDEDDRTSRGADSLALDAQQRSEFDADEKDVQEKFVIDMTENDGYAIVRKEQIPKPTPPARRKKFSRSPGERFATIPAIRAKRSTPPPERPPPPRGYLSINDDEMAPVSQKAALNLNTPRNYEGDYEEPEILDERSETPRDLQSGEIINKMKYRPLPPPPRPPREKRQRGSTLDSRSDNENSFDDRDGGGERVTTSSVADSCEQNDDLEVNSRFAEVEVSTQTDQLPDDFVCEEFEITEDMKIIEPRRTIKTLEELLGEEQEREKSRSPQMLEDDSLTRGLQRFRDANQRSLSEKSRASSQADRSKSTSRPQTPSAVVIERRVSTPVPNQQRETMVEATLTVQPIDDLDLEEEELRREGLLSDTSQTEQSKSDAESREHTKDEEARSVLSDSSYAPSSTQFDAAVEELLARYKTKSSLGSDDEEVERTLRDYEYQEELRQSSRDEDEPNIDSDDYTKIKDIETEDYASDINKYTKDSQIKYDFAESKSDIAEEGSAKALEEIEEQVVNLEAEEPPQPPPRRKSAGAIEPLSQILIVPETKELPKDVLPVESVQQSQLPCRMGDLEVERLRVHALQAGQIMVSQLHGTQISSDELDCKSGNLVVKNIELPAGFIEDIVERVRNTDRSAMLTTETQTSLKNSIELLPTEQTSSPPRDLVPPPKPPRHRDLESAPTTIGDVPDINTLKELRNLDEETQTDVAGLRTNLSEPSPPINPTVEYLQSLAPLAFYNLQKTREPQDEESPERHHRHHHHHHHHRKRSSSSSEEDPEVEIHERRHRSRSVTHPPETQTVSQAGRQFISACSLSLVNIINQLTSCVRSETDKDKEAGSRQVPTLAVLFIVITFGLLLFLLSGKNVHTHHWDFFNPPGNNGRQS